MNRLEWNDFLSSWQDEALHLISLIPEHVLDQQAKAALFSGRPMSESASLDTVSAAQLRLGYDLPVELTDFFLTSNGWVQYGFDEHDLEILAIEDAYFLLDAGKALREGLSAYAESQGGSSERNFFRNSDLDKVVLLSDHKSGCYLVNLAGPFAGECVVVRWHAAPQLFSSFSNLMIFERVRCLNGLRSMLD